MSICVQIRSAVYSSLVMFTDSDNDPTADTHVPFCSTVLMREYYFKITVFLPKKNLRFLRSSFAAQVIEGRQTYVYGCG